MSCGHKIGSLVRPINTVGGKVSSRVSMGKEMLSMKTEAQAPNRPCLSRTFSHRIFSIQRGAKASKIGCLA